MDLTQKQMIDKYMIDQEVSIGFNRQVSYKIVDKHRVARQYT